MLFRSQNPDLTNAIKGNRNAAIELKKSIDVALNQASKGEWDKYLQTYIEKIKPIEEGKAFQGVLDLFKTAPRYGGTDIAEITPFKMRKAAAQSTYKELGTSLKDILSPEGRQFLDQAASAMSAMEGTRKGLRAIEGSQTRPLEEFITSNLPRMLPRLAGQGLEEFGAGAKGKAEQLLVDAIRNPERFQSLLNVYNKSFRKSGPSATEATGLQRLFGTAGAVAGQR